MRLLITRPEEDAQPLARALKKRGHETIIEALMIINNVAAPNLKISGVQALLITSANGIRAFARVNVERNIQVCAVGDASARTACNLGFKKVRSAAGDVETLATMVKNNLDPADGALLHIAGSYHAGDLAKLLTGCGFKTKRTVLYEAQEVRKLSPSTRRALKKQIIDGILFFSPRTAELFCRLINESTLIKQYNSLTAYCLSTAVANAASELPWASIIVAKNPDTQSLLDAIEQKNTGMRNF
jgi:uroporphyrinogen-III synthase